jgi:hypothetical protein
MTKEFDFILEMFDILIPAMIDEQVCFDSPETISICIDEQEGNMSYNWGNIIGLDKDYANNKLILLQVSCGEEEYELPYAIARLIDDSNILQLMKEKIEDLIKFEVKLDEMIKKTNIIKLIKEYKQKRR